MKKIINKFSSSDKLKQIFVLGFCALVLVGAQRLNAVTTWSDPEGAPPSGAILAPITIGASSSTVQVVNGTLSMDILGVFNDAFIEGLLVVGTTSSPTSASTTLLVSGDVGADNYCDTSGENCFDAEAIVSSLTDVDEGVSCPATPDYSSMNYGAQTSGYFNQSVFGEGGYYGASSYGSTLGSTNSENRWDRVTIPSSCISNDVGGCVIRQKIYKRYDKPGWSGWYIDKLYAVRDYEFRQDTSSGATAEPLWWSAHNTAGNKKNGDTTSSNVIKAFSYIYLRDDNTSSAAETDNDKLSAYDLTRGYGFEIYFCAQTDL